MGARHQAAARWRNEGGQGVGRCEMLWVGDVGDWGGALCAEGGGEIGEGRTTWALWKWLGSWLCLLSLGAPRRRKGLTAILIIFLQSDLLKWANDTYFFKKNIFNPN